MERESIEVEARGRGASGRGANEKEKEDDVMLKVKEDTNMEQCQLTKIMISDQRSTA